VHEKLESAHGGINASECRSFDLSPQDYPMQVMFFQWFLQQFGTSSSLPAFVIFMEEAQYTTMESRIFTINIYGQMKIHM
jgi:hypothetical protein